MFVRQAALLQRDPTRAEVMLLVTEARLDNWSTDWP